MAGRSRRPLSSADVLAEIFRDSASENEESSGSSSESEAKSDLASSPSEDISGMFRIS